VEIESAWLIALLCHYTLECVHRSAEVTKALVAAYYGRPPEHS
jgi:hypothetical protein